MSPPPHDERPRVTRRAVLGAGAAALAAPSLVCAGAAADARPVVDDYSRLNPVRVARVLVPRDTAAIRAALHDSTLPVSVGGGRFSMGGQVAAADSLHLDMRGMNAVLAIDRAQKTARVQAGATWRDLQTRLDPLDLAVRIMQSYSNFTVGGSLSVNCHGRYVGRGPMINSIRAVQFVTAGGEVMEVSRSAGADLFAAVVGGYGGLGVVTEVELDLDVNTPLVRDVEQIPFADYPAYFHERVLDDPTVLLHNADLTPPRFAAPTAVTWRVTEQLPAGALRLVPRGLDYTREQNALWAMTELPAGHLLRPTLERYAKAREGRVAWRNHEASLDTASLEPRTRAISTYLLQEYFIPVPQMLAFSRAMARILRRHDVEALNVSIRHSPRDDTTLLRWAAVPVFSFVLY